MPKTPRLYHLWLGTALAGTAGLSLTTYSERLLVPQGFAPAGLVAAAELSPGGRTAPVPPTTRPGGPAADGTALAAAPDTAADRSGARRMIDRPAGNPADPAPPAGPPALGYASPDPATREMHRLLAMGSGPALPRNFANGQDPAQARLLRTAALPPSIIPGAGPNPKSTNSPHPEPTAGPTGTPTGTPTATPTGEPSAGPNGAPTSSPSAGPTNGPTTGPTSGPSEAPTGSPSGKPTAGPITEPSAGPTTGPTGGPTAGPSTEPQSGPTAGPPAGPTVSPNAEPTPGPSAGPTPGFTPDPPVGPPVGAAPTAGPGAPDVAAAVPEPSTWLMLLLGLGVLGHALRTGRRLAAGSDPDASEPA